MTQLFRRFLIAIVATSAIAGTSVMAQQPAASAQPNRLVVQVSDGDAARWNMALNNIRNVQSELGATNVDIVLVAYGPGIGMLKFDAITASRVTDAMKSGVKVVACENTMVAQKVSRSDMHPDIGYVPAGAVEIMKRQQQGYAYLRP